MILSVDIAEDRDHVKTYAESQGLTFQILLDQRSEAARTYLVRGIPATFLIDRDGVIQAAHKGPLDEATIDALVASHLE